MSQPTIFFSWQADTPAREGRNFIEEALKAAIKRIGQDATVEEAARDLALDKDTAGVGGTPPIFDTILRKIDKAGIFVPDLTLTCKRPDGRPSPNPNVLIEYGWALKSLSYNRIICVMNAAVGDPSTVKMPFDLDHLRRPITYNCPIGADAGTRNREIKELAKKLEHAIKTVLSSDEYLESLPKPPPFPAIASTTSPAVYFQPRDILARIGVPGEDEIEYRFNEPRAFYLRLLPTKELEPQLKIAVLKDLVEKRRVLTIMPSIGGLLPYRNEFGAIAFEPHGTATTPRSFTQLFPNGEFWSVTTHLTRHPNGIMAILNVMHWYNQALENFSDLATTALSIPLPYKLEFGAIGLKGARLALPNGQLSDLIHRPALMVECKLADAAPHVIHGSVREFIDALLDLAGETWRPEWDAR